MTPLTESCIISVATGPYAKIQGRLIDSLARHDYAGDVLYWCDAYPDGSPTHQESPYSFKTFALMEAQRRGYDLALWLDASMWAKADVQPIFDHIAAHGHLFEQSGHRAGQWCHDAALETLGMTRDEMMDVLMFSAGFTGLDLRIERSREFLRRWHALSIDGVTFPGPWTNANGECSDDPRVRGHRHDMTAASVVAYRLGMALIPPTFMAYDGYENTPETALVMCRGC
jgi:hypothetical protein